MRVKSAGAVLMTLVALLVGVLVVDTDAPAGDHGPQPVLADGGTDHDWPWG